VGRTMKDWSPPGCLADQLGSAVEVTAELSGREAQQVAVALAVEADLVAGCRHLGSDGGPPLDLLSNQEERRRYLGVVQNLQCGHRSLWVGAVVESQRDTFLAAEARRYAKPDCQGRENRHESG